MPERSLALYLSVEGKWRDVETENAAGACLNEFLEKEAGGVGVATLRLKPGESVILNVLTGYDEGKPVFVEKDLPTFACLEAVEMFL
jgi:hypothetical protein